MSPRYKLTMSERTIPGDFSQSTVNAIKRIEDNTHVLGVLFFRNRIMEMSTVPLTMTPILSMSLPPITLATRRAVRELTATINNVNPIVDRLMEDDSVEGVIMTNKEGTPILTNINLTSATNFGIALRRLGVLTQISIAEVDPLDEVIVLRINTKKLEMMVAPHKEFNIIVVQHDSRKLKNKKDD